MVEFEFKSHCNVVGNTCPGLDVTCVSGTSFELRMSDHEEGEELMPEFEFVFAAIVDDELVVAIVVAVEFEVALVTDSVVGPDTPVFVVLV